jgi:hypothetical protein
MRKVNTILVDKKIEGMINVSDPIKQSTPDAVAELHQRNVKVIMLTGDNLQHYQNTDCCSRLIKSGNCGTCDNVELVICISKRFVNSECQIRLEKPVYITEIIVTMI